MASHDNIGDFLTIIRNASNARKDSCCASWSNIREGIVKILKDSGYIADFAVSGEKAEKKIEITLKYVGGVPAITQIERVSKPGRRLYYSCSDIPRVLGGMGISILTTSRGVLTDGDCRKNKAGGELICKVW